MTNAHVQSHDNYSPGVIDSLDDAIARSELLWTFLNSDSGGALLCDSGGSIRWASPSIERLTGYHPSRLIGVNVTSLIADGHRDQVLQRVMANNDETASPILSCQTLGIDGAPAWYDVEVSHLAHGGAPVVLVTLRDASQRVATVNNLRASEARFRSIVNEAPFGIGLQDHDGNFVFLNSRLKQIMGVDANYLLREELEQRIHPDDLTLAISSSRTAHADTSEDISVRFIRPNGELRWCSARVLPQRDHSGAISNYLWATEDVTARVRAEQDQSRLYNLMEASSDLVMVFEPDYSPLYLNPSARRFLGVPLDEDLGQGHSLVRFETMPSATMDTIRQHVAAREIWQGELTVRSFDGRWEPFSAMVVPDADSSGHVSRISAVLRDITERKEFEKRLEWEATHDPLTDLPNRILLTNRLAAALDRAQRDSTLVAIAFLDLDNFRIINESLGHKVGDNLLKQTAEKLAGLVWAQDTVSRFGADEFAILMENLTSVEEAIHLTERIRRAVSGRVGMREVELLMTFSAGVAVSDGTRGDPSSILRDANAALHEAKLKGRDRTETFTGTLRARAVDRLTVETGLRRALRRDELRLFYQPQVSLATGRVNGAEALIRWQHPENGILGPGEFISIAEMSGLILPIGSWVLREACRQLATWSRELPRGDQFRMGINLSGKQLVQASLIDEMSELIESCGINPNRIELEITESILLDDVDRSLTVLERLKALGVRLSLDDFGTGYSSLTYLRSFPIDVVKIDRSFVDGIGKDNENAAIVKSIIDLARTLGLECIAEGVETNEDLQALRALGCDVAQGYLIAQPLSSADAARMISYDPSW